MLNQIKVIGIWERTNSPICLTNKGELFMKIKIETASYKVRDGTFSLAEFADLLGISEELLQRELPQSGIPYIMSEHGKMRIPYDCVERILFR